MRTYRVEARALVEDREYHSLCFVRWDEQKGYPSVHLAGVLVDLQLHLVKLRGKGADLHCITLKTVDPATEYGGKSVTYAERSPWTDWKPLGLVIEEVPHGK